MLDTGRLAPSREYGLASSRAWLLAPGGCCARAGTLPSCFVDTSPHVHARRGNTPSGQSVRIGAVSGIDGLSFRGPFPYCKNHPTQIPSDSSQKDGCSSTRVMRWSTDTLVCFHESFGDGIPPTLHHHNQNFRLNLKGLRCDRKNATLLRLECASYDSA